VGVAQEHGVVGETPNLAARLQALSTPNTLVIGEATRRQIGGLFDLEDLGLQQLAGAAFRQGLSETGYVEGQNVAIEYRWAEGTVIACPDWPPTSSAARST
jgi:hypothetical protein